MVTGDHPATALAIAHEVGIRHSRVLTGMELEMMPAEALDEAVKEANVFARVAPEHKLRLVEALKQNGGIVAMTGDGVNDAPALKRSDVGVAMGERGSDVSREVADLVLMDDNFATIVAAVEEGRNISELRAASAAGDASLGARWELTSPKRRGPFAKPRRAVRNRRRKWMETLEPLLIEHPFLRDLPQGDIQFLAGCAKNARFEAGQVIFREGEVADQFYLIRDGRVALEVFTTRGPAPIQTISAGDVLGWSWLIPPYKWRFDARAIEATRAFALDGKCLREKCEEDSRLGYELLKRVAAIIADRLHATRLQMLDVYGAHD
jgi:hypothetical protein